MIDTLPPWPILMHPADIVGMKEAEDISGRDARTVRKWCKEFGIGHQVSRNSPWEISAPALVMVRHGDMAALAMLRDGNRIHPRVKRVFDFLGMSA